MKKIQLERSFKATPERLWELVVDADHYRYWTSVFSIDSDFIGDWTKGSQMRFIADNPSESENGMLSEITESKWPEVISIHHIGLIIKGVKDYDSPMSKEWTPAYEIYRFVEKSDSQCTFKVEQDIPDAYVETFTTDWNQAFDAMARILDASDVVGRVIALRERSTHSPLELWDRLVNPEKIMTWNFDSDDWHCPQAKNDLKVGGEFHYEMAAKDGSFSFDFWGVFTEIVPGAKLNFDLGDGRKVRINLIVKPYGTLIEERFEAEHQNDLHLQRTGWQNILRNLAR